MKKKKKRGAQKEKLLKRSKISAQSIAKQHPEVQGFLLFIFSLALLISLVSFAYSNGSTNKLGLIGEFLGKVFHVLFGISSYIICFFLGWIGWRKWFLKPINHLFLKTIYVTLMVFSVSILVSLIEDRFFIFSKKLGQIFYTSAWDGKPRLRLGGDPFFYIYHDLPIFNLFRILNSFGTGIIFSGTFLASFMFLFKINPRKILKYIKESYEVPHVEECEEVIPELFIEEDHPRFVKLRTSETPKSLPQKKEEMHELLEIQPEKNLKERPSVSRKTSESMMVPSFPFDLPVKKEPVQEKEEKPKKDEFKSAKEVAQEVVQDLTKIKRKKALEAQSIYNGDFSQFKLPSPSFLTNPKKIDQSSLKQNLKRQAEVLEETLSSFGIEAKVGQINCGPSINSFEVHPAIGVKVQKIKALENDIALNMEAKSIRIIAPIPGKAAVGIEIPNPQPQEVAFKDMLMAYQQGSRKFHIPILLGKAVNGDFVMSDLTKMPHCIIAGATGSGKSVCINTIVMSIVMNAKPDEIKLIMVDPKKVELTPYSRLPHMLAPVITEPQGACAALMWLVKEMEVRYEILKLTGVRNIDSFNNRIINPEFEQQLDREIPAKMQYIVAIIDELADLMMVSSSDIETPIARIAQMARAVGIHLILATQRPSREVITGLIKANFPTRISFKVASRVNSQIILDEVGAETLLGNGDMLFLPPGTSNLIRAQGAFIRDDDINLVIKHICDQAPPNYVIQSFDTMTEFEGISSEKTSEAPRDSLYHEALNIVVGSGVASTTFLQRKLKIGYARAASLIDELETQGIIGSMDGGKNRRVLVKEENREDSNEPFLGIDLEGNHFEGNEGIEK